MSGTARHGEAAFTRLRFRLPETFSMNNICEESKECDQKIAALVCQMATEYGQRQHGNDGSDSEPLKLAEPGNELQDERSLETSWKRKEKHAP